MVSLRLIPWVYGEIVRHLSRAERVHVLIERESIAAARRVFEEVRRVDLDSVDFIPCATDRSWTRDFCPIFVKDAKKQTTILDWRFNGWAKYPNWKQDDAVPWACISAKKLYACLRFSQCMKGGELCSKAAVSM